MSTSLARIFSDATYYEDYLPDAIERGTDTFEPWQWRDDPGMADCYQALGECRQLTDDLPFDAPFVDALDHGYCQPVLDLLLSAGKEGEWHEQLSLLFDSLYLTEDQVQAVEDQIEDEETLLIDIVTQKMDRDTKWMTTQALNVADGTTQASKAYAASPCGQFARRYGYATYKPRKAPWDFVQAIPR